MRQKLLCAIVLLLGSQVAYAQQWPNYKEAYSGNPAANSMPYPYGAPGFRPPAGAPGYGYPGPFYIANPYQAAYANPYQAAYANPYYPPAFYPPAPQSFRPAGYIPEAPAGQGPVMAPQGPMLAPPVGPSCPPPAAVAPCAPACMLPPDLADIPHPEKPAEQPRREHLGWVSLQYLASWLRPEKLPGPLLTNGDPNDITPGAVGQPGTIPLFGQNGLDFGMFTGFRLESGLWLDKENCYSADVGGFALLRQNIKFNAASDANGNPALIRPIFDVIKGQEAGELVAFPGIAAGVSSITATADLFGLEVNARCHLYPSPRLEAETLFGFRFLDLRETLQISDQLTPLAANRITFNGQFVPVGDQLADLDQFSTRNRFFGFQMGEQIRREFGPFFLSDFGNIPFRFFLSGFGKIAIGLTDETVNINGQTTLFDPAGNQTAQGGILAQPSNIGGNHRAVFGFVPEVGLSFGFDITNHFRVQTGYSCLMWNAVVRPGSTIDRNINTFQVPSDQNFGKISGPPSPTFTFRDEWFWVNNFYFGAEVRY